VAPVALSLDTNEISAEFTEKKLSSRKNITRLAAYFKGPWNFLEHRPRICRHVGITEAHSCTAAVEISMRLYVTMVNTRGRIIPSILEHFLPNDSAETGIIRRRNGSVLNGA